MLKEYELITGLTKLCTPTIRGYTFCRNQNEANEYACELTYEDYNKLQGSYGIKTWEELYDELSDTFGREPTDDEVLDEYVVQARDWIEFWAKEVN